MNDRDISVEFDPSTGRVSLRLWPPVPGYPSVALADAARLAQALLAVPQVAALLHPDSSFTPPVAPFGPPKDP